MLQIHDGVRAGWEGRWEDEDEEVTERESDGEEALSGNAEEVREQGGEGEIQ